MAATPIVWDIDIVSISLQLIRFNASCILNKRSTINFHGLSCLSLRLDGAPIKAIPAEQGYFMKLPSSAKPARFTGDFQCRINTSVSSIFTLDDAVLSLPTSTTSSHPVFPYVSGCLNHVAQMTPPPMMAPAFSPTDVIGSFRDILDLIRTSAAQNIRRSPCVTPCPAPRSLFNFAQVWTKIPPRRVHSFQRSKFRVDLYVLSKAPRPSNDFIQLLEARLAPCGPGTVSLIVVRSPSLFANRSVVAGGPCSRFVIVEQSATERPDPSIAVAINLEMSIAGQNSGDPLLAGLSRAQLHLLPRMRPCPVPMLVDTGRSLWRSIINGGDYEENNRFLLVDWTLSVFLATKRSPAKIRAWNSLRLAELTAWQSGDFTTTLVTSQPTKTYDVVQIPPLILQASETDDGRVAITTTDWEGCPYDFQLNSDLVEAHSFGQNGHERLDVSPDLFVTPPTDTSLVVVALPSACCFLDPYSVATCLADGGPTTLAVIALIVTTRGASFIIELLSHLLGNTRIRQDQRLIRLDLAPLLPLVASARHLSHLAIMTCYAFDPFMSGTSEVMPLHRVLDTWRRQPIMSASQLKPATGGYQAMFDETRLYFPLPTVVEAAALLQSAARAGDEDASLRSLRDLLEILVVEVPDVLENMSQMDRITLGVTSHQRKSCLTKVKRLARFLCLQGLSHSSSDCQSLDCVVCGSPTRILGYLALLLALNHDTKQRCYFWKGMIRAVCQPALPPCVTRNVRDLMELSNPPTVSRGGLVNPSSMLSVALLVSLGIFYQSAVEKDNSVLFKALSGARRPYRQLFTALIPLD